jgi:hypothetical protein
MKLLARKKRNDDPLKYRLKAIRKFSYYFPRGFDDKKYIAWERDYKWNAHIQWNEKLNKNEFGKLLAQKKYEEIAKRVVTIESKTNLLFSFEKMAFRDAVKTPASAHLFAKGLFDYIYGKGSIEPRFTSFRDILASLPVKQTRVLTWPLITVLGFIADPTYHIFLKPVVTRRAAEKYQYDFFYKPAPNWKTYQSLLDFAELIRKDAEQLHPKDMIDLQSFIWVTGSEEYPD